MMTNAQFTQWVKDQSSKVTVLAAIKFGYQAGGVPAEGTFYLADRPYVTGPTDSPANTRFRNVIISSPDSTRMIDLEKLGGRGTIATGPLKLLNADGSLDWMLDVILDGRDIAFYVGDFSWPFSWFRLVKVDTIGIVREENDEELTLELRDRNYLLDASIVGPQIAVGPNAGKTYPVVLGTVFNFDLSSYLLDATGPTYVLNNASLASFANVSDVRDSGVSLQKTGFTATNATLTANAATDTLTFAAHGLAVNDVLFYFGAGGDFTGLSHNVQYWVISAGLTANDFRLSLTRGGAAVDITGTTFAGSVTVRVRRWYVDAAFATLTLSSTPVGRVTTDFSGSGVSGNAVFMDVPHSAFRHILDAWTRLLPADRDETAFSTLSSAELVTIKWGYAVLDRSNVLDVLDLIALLTNSWYAWTVAGILTVGKLDFANLDAATPIDSILKGDFETEISVENMPIKFGRLLLDSVPNVVTQTDGLAASLTETQRSLYARKFQQRVKSTDLAGADYLNDWWNYHKSAIDAAPLETAIATTGSIVPGVQCDERVALFKPWTRVVKGTVGLDKYGLNPGDCVSVTHPRYGLSSGKNFRVISVKTRISDRAVDLVLARQSTPDYLTASHV